MKKYLIAGSVILVLTVAACLSTLSSKQEQMPVQTIDKPMKEYPETGYLAPNLELTEFNGKRVQLRDLRGKPVLLNFWASWCGPCRAEMPDLDKEYHQYKNQLHFYGINMTSMDSEENASAFIRELGVTFLNLKDTDGRAEQAYQVKSIPATFAIDSNGVIVEKRRGALSKSALEGVLRRLVAPK